MIGVAELGGRVIVAVPGAAWHRKTKSRKLPSNALGKALSLDCVDLQHTPLLQGLEPVRLNLNKQPAPNNLRFKNPDFST